MKSLEDRKKERRLRRLRVDPNTADRPLDDERQNAATAASEAQIAAEARDRLAQAKKGGKGGKGVAW